ncbi:hypothetical protein I79_020126 [Cricetulus griseus]|uniref:Uncharacterized protein n=1 Tax=Cricetulus griseus TaxID=10029 RepID=G3I991_CRIGR|nr:hypothetical protein I79_020126 [Cricetulus griseus]
MVSFKSRPKSPTARLFITRVTSELARGNVCIVLHMSRYKVRKAARDFKICNLYSIATGKIEKDAFFLQFTL